VSLYGTLGVEGLRDPEVGMDRMKVNENLYLTLWDALNTRLGPLQWDLVESDASAQSLAKGGGTLPHYTR
jgi:hypothetical protein